MIEKGNMTDAEYIAALIAENKTAQSDMQKLESDMKKLERENKKLQKEKSYLEKEIDKKNVEIECLKKDNHIFLEALILSKSLFRIYLK